MDNSVLLVEQGNMKIFLWMKEQKEFHIMVTEDVKPSTDIIFPREDWDKLTRLKNKIGEAVTWFDIQTKNQETDES